jgi:hypothetical protein
MNKPSNGAWNKEGWTPQGFWATEKFVLNPHSPYPKYIESARVLNVIDGWIRTANKVGAEEGKKAGAGIRIMTGLLQSVRKEIVREIIDEQRREIGADEKQINAEALVGTFDKLLETIGAISKDHEEALRLYVLVGELLVMVIGGAERETSEKIVGILREKKKEREGG